MPITPFYRPKSSFPLRNIVYLKVLLKLLKSNADKFVYFLILIFFYDEENSSMADRMDQRRSGNSPILGRWSTFLPALLCKYFTRPEMIFTFLCWRMAGHVTDWGALVPLARPALVNIYRGD